MNGIDISSFQSELNAGIVPSDFVIIKATEGTNYINPSWEEQAGQVIQTFAQAMIGALGAGATGLIGIDWIQALSIAGFATLISILTSIASLGIGDDTASLVNNKKEGE